MTDDRTNTASPSAAVSRRMVLGSTSVLGGLALAACSGGGEQAALTDSDVIAPERTPTPPSDLPQGYAFLSDAEARTIEAVAARIIPGDADDPGAVEAGVVFYIDSKLARFETFAEPTYERGPFAQGYAGTQPPAVADGWVLVPQNELERYGFQSPLTHRQLYRRGIPGLNRYSHSRFGAAFADLPAVRQDQILMFLDGSPGRQDEGSRGGADGVGEGQEDSSGSPNARQGRESAGGGGNGLSERALNQIRGFFQGVDPEEFFTTVRGDTIEGMFADPVYGGNRNLVGWRLVGYPGAQRSYSPAEMLRGTDKQPQSMHGLPAMNPDRPGAGDEALEQHKPGVRQG